MNKLVIDEKALYSIKDIARRLFHDTPAFNRDLCLLQALHSYMIEHKIEPKFEVKNVKAR